MSRMPLLFIGHGSPMNAVEDNEFTRYWRKIAAVIPRPGAILSISAHWFTDGTRLCDDEEPKTVYDMYGFPPELYRITYGAPGAPLLARATREMVKEGAVIDNSWGYDHGTWSVLRVMYPGADIPLYQMSIDRKASPGDHFDMGRKISGLRDRGVLIMASGNVVHNLEMADFAMDRGYPWATDFDSFIRERIMERDYRSVIDYRKSSPFSGPPFITPEHYYPLLYALGASREMEDITVFNDSVVLGSVSMTCYLFSGQEGRLTGRS